MAAGLARGEFFLEYQPLVALADDTTRRVEALLRWRHPRLGLVPRDRIVALAQENGHLGLLGRWALITACRAAARWRACRPAAPLGVAVDVGAGQLHDPELPAQVAAVLTDTGLPPQLLHLELAESAVLGAASGPVDALSGLAGTGVRLVVDGFGTGYSHLARLTRLPVSELKIPPSLLADVPGHDRILPAIISLAHAMGLAVAAEGVRTRAQVELLRTLRCDIGQGPWFGAPMSADEVTELLAARRAPGHDGVGRRTAG
jgi:EAL domain-containing protein (putative c-di-GMP-specific phosphodiesterase class I)